MGSAVDGADAGVKTAGVADVVAIAGSVGFAGSCGAVVGVVDFGSIATGVAAATGGSLDFVGAGALVVVRTNTASSIRSNAR